MTADAPGSDEALIAAAKAGDAAAFGDLVRRHEPRVHRFLAQLTGNREDARDLGQEVFIRFHRHLPRHRPGARVEPWLFTVARRRAIDLLRARRAQVPLDERLPAPPGPPPGGDLWDFARAVLSPRAFALLWLRYGEDLPVGEAAARFGCSPVAARVALHRARRTLARALDADARASVPLAACAARHRRTEAPS